MDPAPLECHDCGSTEIVRVIEDSDDASGYKGDLALCAECLKKRLGLHGD